MKSRRSVHRSLRQVPRGASARAGGHGKIQRIRSIARHGKREPCASIARRATFNEVTEIPQVAVRRTGVLGSRSRASVPAENAEISARSSRILDEEDVSSRHCWNHEGSLVWTSRPRTRVLRCL